MNILNARVLSVAILILIFGIGAAIFRLITLSSSTGYLYPISDNQNSVMVETYPVEGYRVDGNELVGPFGPHTIYGVTRPSLEWGCGENLREFDYSEMRSWGFNLVRLPLNQHLWIENIFCEKDDIGKPVEMTYQDIVSQQVLWARKYELDILLDLHWVEGPADDKQALYPMPDARSLIFWESMAALYGNDPDILFELYAEPHEVSADVWLHGGVVESPSYIAVGMQDLVAIIRESGSSNILLIKGLDWGFDYRNLELPVGQNLIYGAHPYGHFSYHTDPRLWSDYFGFIADQAPLIISEFGDAQDCSGAFDQEVLDYAYARQLSWIAWAWYPGGCSFPSLITSWEAEPSLAGEVVKKALVRDTQ